MIDDSRRRTISAAPRLELRAAPRHGPGDTAGTRHSDREHTWGLVLAAGEGNRLSSLTTDARGVVIPKQYCAFNGRQPLLLDTIERGLPFASPARMHLVVAAQHRAWWHHCRSLLNAENIVVQPLNRGTGNGILLPLLAILDRDPQADIVILPSDHYVRDEAVLQHSIGQAMRALRGGGSCLVMLGIAPEAADSDLGYIVPGFSTEGGSYTVRRFVEKPHAPLAEHLLTRGALWNSFIMVASGARLLDLYKRQFPAVVDALIKAWQAVPADGGRSLRALYEVLPNIDFSHHVLRGTEPLLRVLRVPACGWSDLGTPRRVAHLASRRVAVPSKEGPTLTVGWRAPLNLLEAHHRRSNGSAHPALRAHFGEH